MEKAKEIIAQVTDAITTFIEGYMDLVKKLIEVFQNLGKDN